MSEKQNDGCFGYLLGLTAFVVGIAMIVANVVEKAKAFFKAITDSFAFWVIVAVFVLVTVVQFIFHGEYSRWMTFNDFFDLISGKKIPPKRPENEQKRGKTGANYNG